MGRTCPSSLVADAVGYLAALTDMPRAGDSIASQPEPATTTRPGSTDRTGIRSGQIVNWRGRRASAVKGRRRSPDPELRRIKKIKGGNIVVIRGKILFGKRTLLTALLGLLMAMPAMAISADNSNNTGIMSYQVQNGHRRCTTCGSHRERPPSACTPRIGNRLPVYGSAFCATCGLVAGQIHLGALWHLPGHGAASAGVCSRYRGTGRLVYDTEAAWKLWRKFKDRQKQK